LALRQGPRNGRRLPARVRPCWRWTPDFLHEWSPRSAHLAVPGSTARAVQRGARIGLQRINSFGSPPTATRAGFEPGWISPVCEKLVTHLIEPCLDPLCRPVLSAALSREHTSLYLACRPDFRPDGAPGALDTPGAPPVSAGRGTPVKHGQLTSGGCAEVICRAPGLFPVTGACRSPRPDSTFGPPRCTAGLRKAGGASLPVLAGLCDIFSCSPRPDRHPGHRTGRPQDAPATRWSPERAAADTALRLRPWIERRPCSEAPWRAAAGGASSPARVARLVATSFGARARAVQYVTVSRWTRSLSLAPRRVDDE